MLSKILDKKTCSLCKICCNYSSESLWDIPGFTSNEYENIKINYPELIIKSYQKNNLYYFETTQTEDNKYICPFISKKGCILGKNKPFKCSIWPLYVVHYEDNIYLAISNVCPNIKITSNEIKNELKDSINMIRQMIKTHPELIESYRDHYTLLIKLDIY